MDAESTAPTATTAPASALDNLPPPPAITRGWRSPPTAHGNGVQFEHFVINLDRSESFSNVTADSDDMFRIILEYNLNSPIEITVPSDLFDEDNIDSLLNNCITIDFGF